MNSAIRLRLGTRASALARWQAEWVAGQLQQRGIDVELVLIATQGDVQSFLSSLLTLISSQSKASQMTCSSCGMSYEEFQRTGKLGCAQCYHAFEEELRPLLTRIHGRSQHAGRAPGGTEKQAQIDAGIDELRIRMEKAVSAEDFEEAAKLRDEIRALIEKREKENQP